MIVEYEDSGRYIIEKVFLSQNPNTKKTGLFFENGREITFQEMSHFNMAFSEEFPGELDFLKNWVRTQRNLKNIESKKSSEPKAPTKGSWRA